MKRVLLIGKDPLFAWAMQKKISSFSCYLEHVYTFSEAQLRLSRFRYDVVLFDDICSQEIEKLSADIQPNAAVFLLNDAFPEKLHGFSDVVFVAKETALSEIVSTFKKLQLI